MSGLRLGLLLQRCSDGAGPRVAFGAMTPFAERVAQMGRREGVDVIAFSPGDYDTATGRLYAGTWSGPASGWQFGSASLPHVVWNRCLVTGPDEVFDALLKRGVLPFNRGRLDKWEAHCCLSVSPQIAPHLPCTEVLTGAEVVQRMLEQFPVIYLKPVTGCVGRGIIRALREPLGNLRLQYVSTETGGVREAYAGREQLDRWIERTCSEVPYIAQQGLDLTAWFGRPADVRALVQKDGTGRWCLTGAGARVAAAGRFTANLHTGGQGLPVESLARRVAPYDPAARDALLADLERLALEGARLIEQRLGSMGELGLDFGIDPSGKIWFIEQNAQPGRAIFEHMQRWDLADLAHLRPVQYCRHLVPKKTRSAAVIVAT